MPSQLQQRPPSPSLSCALESADQDVALQCSGAFGLCCQSFSWHYFPASHISGRSYLPLIRETATAALGRPKPRAHVLPPGDPHARALLVLLEALGFTVATHSESTTLGKVLWRMGWARAELLNVSWMVLLCSRLAVLSGFGWFCFLYFCIQKLQDFLPCNLETSPLMSFQQKQICPESLQCCHSCTGRRRVMPLRHSWSWPPGTLIKHP